MILFYKIDDPTAILYTENSVMVPTIPTGTPTEQKEILAQNGINYVSIPYEMGDYISFFKLSFDANGNFTGLQPK